MHLSGFMSCYPMWEQSLQTTYSCQGQPRCSGVPHLTTCQRRRHMFPACVLLKCVGNCSYVECIKVVFCCLLTAKVQSHTGQEEDSLANQKVTGTITIADDNGWRWWHVQAWRQSCLHYLPDGQWMPKKTKLHRLNEPVLFNPLYKRTCQGTWEFVFDLAKNDCLLQVVWDVLLSSVWGQWFLKM